MNKRDVERQAEQAVLVSLGEYVANIGLEIPLSQYSKEQIAGLVSTTIECYHNALQRLTQDEIPF